MMISIWHATRLFLCLFFVAFLSSCGGGGSGSSAATHQTVVASLTSSSSGAKIGDSNVLALSMDAGPTGSGGLQNIMYATIQVCALNSTTNCTNVDHVLVDTGSTGLRLLASALPSSLLSALPAITVSGNPVGECLTFVSGFTWGGVRQLDLHVGGTNYTGETASNISVQIIGDTASQVASIPSSCTTAAGYNGTDPATNQPQTVAQFITANGMQTVAQLGANGVIGIGLFKQDCGIDCATVPLYAYQVCASAGNCSNYALSLPQQVSNPISSFNSLDKNGSSLVWPALASGYADSVSGMLVFGVDTQTNNVLASGSNVIGALPYSSGTSRGTFTASINGVTGLTGSYIDSGTNWNYFPTTGAVSTVFPYCSSAVTYLCPANPTTQIATLTGTATTTGSATVYTANINNIFTIDPNANAILGFASSSPTNVVLGGSFFFGRSITTLIENQSAASGFSATGGLGPAYAYTP